METRGRKPVYDTPSKLRTAIEEYFDKCDELKVFPDFAGMKRELKLSRKDIEEMQSESNPMHEEYKYVFECAMDRRESWLSRRMVTDNKAANGCMNALKQPINGGYADKPSENGDRTLKINLVGVGGWDAFK